MTLRLTLEPGESGPARVTIERFDPFAGWLFARRVSTTIVGGTDVEAVDVYGRGEHESRSHSSIGSISRVRSMWSENPGALTRKSPPVDPVAGPG